MSTPPEQAQATEPETPTDCGALVYRLIPVHWCDAKNGHWEFQSGAFDNATPLDESESPLDMSVVLHDALVALDRQPEELPDESGLAEGAPEKWGVASLQVGFLRDEEQEIRPTPKDDELAHGDVRGTKNQNRRRRFKRHARWVVEPSMPAS